jgi:hypothetical protein
VTLIAIHAAADYADILTDTWLYPANARTIRRTSKTLVVPHLDMAYVTRGSELFGWEWTRAASQLGDGVSDFDEYIDQVQGLASSLWDSLQAMVAATFTTPGRTLTLDPPAVFYAGYSPSRGTFRAVGFSHHDGFAPWDIDGLFVVPSPFGVRPSEFELHEIESGFAREPGPEDGEVLAQFRSWPVPRVPETEDGWAGLAVAARSTRSTLSPSTCLKILVGGDVHRTHLERGQAVQALTYRFDEDGTDELAAVVSGTMHPLSQLGPCPYGHDSVYRDCCLLPYVAEPCRCKSGLPLGECCLLSDDEAATWAARMPT